MQKNTTSDVFDHPDIALLPHNGIQNLLEPYLVRYPSFMERSLNRVGGVGGVCKASVARRRSIVPHGLLVYDGAVACQALC